MDNEELLRKLRQAFKIESEERIATISSGLIELEGTSEFKKQKKIIESVFREAHSLKGAARAVNLVEIETVCHALESVFSALLHSKIAVTAEFFDSLYRAVSTIEMILANPESTQAESQKQELAAIVRLLNDLKKKDFEIATRIIVDVNGEEITDLRTGKFEIKEELCKPEEDNKLEPEPVKESEQMIEEPKSATAIRPHFQETVRISAARLDSLFLMAEEFIALKLASKQHLDNLNKAALLIENWVKKYSKTGPVVRTLSRQIQSNNKAKPEKIDIFSIKKLLSFIEWNKEQVNTLEQQVNEILSRESLDCNRNNRMVDDLLDEIKTIMLLPFSTLCAPLPRMVRALSQNQGKEINFKIEGEQVEIDRRILEQMKDPIIHLLRNAVDHGIESPETREKQRKKKHGTIELSILRVEGSNVEIVLQDDGRGLDCDKIKEKAVNKGILSQKEADMLDDSQIGSLIFESGISTSPIVTEISGRGLGMSIVSDNIEQLGGKLQVDNKPEGGTTFKILLPISLSTFRGILVEAGGSLFIVPSANVGSVVKIESDRISTVENREVISIDNKPLPLVALADVLGLKRKNWKNSEARFIRVLIMGIEKQKMGFVVDEIIGEQEVLIKSLGPQLKKVTNVSGASVLGNGMVVPILNVKDLLISGVNVSASSTGIDVSEEERADDVKSILVVDDSITSRVLIKNILESTGYLVQTAVDGQEAFATLRTGNFDLVVSDVEMPRMNGFEFTAKIREEPEFAKTPVVLVTGLESSEDREKGIDAGASAYIVKRSFDQTNLLEVVNGLI